MRRLLARLPLGLLLICLAAACQSRDIGNKATSTSDEFRAALITPGPISDQSWNAGAYAGLLLMRDSLGARISHVQSKTPAEFDENFRLYAAQHYSLVIGHGFEFQDAARRVAPNFPKTVFFVTSSALALGPNVAGIRFSFDQASYLAGFLAGALTRSDLVGCIGGTELPPVKASFDAFAAGARAANPRVRVIRSFIGNWEDVGAGREQALAQHARGVDIIFQNADAAGLGVFQAARQSRRLLVIGSNSDQNHVAPEVTLGSVVIDLPHAFLQVAREVKEGRFVARIFEMGGRQNVVRLVLNPAFTHRIPPQIQRSLDSTAALAAAEYATPTTNAR